MPNRLFTSRKVFPGWPPCDATPPMSSMLSAPLWEASCAYRCTCADATLPIAQSCFSVLYKGGRGSDGNDAAARRCCTPPLGLGTTVLALFGAGAADDVASPLAAAAARSSRRFTPPPRHPQSPEQKWRGTQEASPTWPSYEEPCGPSSKAQERTHWLEPKWLEP